VIVKFARRGTKDQFYHGRKHLKNKSTKDIGLSRFSDNGIFVSESLTPKNRLLFKDCLKFKKLVCSVIDNLPRLELSSSLTNIPNLADADVDNNVLSQVDFNYYNITQLMIFKIMNALIKYDLKILPFQLYILI
jgi:hypothetical protein